MNIISEVFKSKKDYMVGLDTPHLFNEFRTLYSSWGDSLLTESALMEFVEVVQQELDISENNIVPYINKSVEAGFMTSEQRDLVFSGLRIVEQDPADSLSEDEEEDALDGEPVEGDPEDISDDSEEVDEEPSEEDSSISSDEIPAPEKEYFGDRRNNNNMEQLFFVKKIGDGGDVEDLVVVDAEDKQVVSAKERGMDITDIEGFLRDSIKGLDMEKLSPDILDRYNYLNVMPEEEEVEELMPEEGEAIGQKEELPSEGDLDFDKKAPVESRSTIREDRDQVLNKAGVNSDDWFRSEDTIYFRGVGEDEARAIAAELGGRLVSAKEFEGKKFYAVVLESTVSGNKVLEQYTVLASGISDEKTADDMARDKKGVKIQDPDNKDAWIVISKEV